MHPTNLTIFCHFLRPHIVICNISLLHETIIEIIFHVHQLQSANSIVVKLGLQLVQTANSKVVKLGFQSGVVRVLLWLCSDRKVTLIMPLSNQFFYPQKKKKKKEKKLGLQLLKDTNFPSHVFDRKHLKKKKEKSLVLNIIGALDFNS